MLRIVISVVENISNTNGTTLRARSIIRALKDKCDILLITRANSIGNVPLASMGIRRSSIKVVKPENTKLWNAKLIPIILSNRFHAVYCVADLFGFFTFYLFSKFLRYKIIFEAHSLAYREKGQFSKLKSTIYYLLEVFIGSRADAIIALSRIVYSFYKRFNKNTFFIPVFIDARQFDTPSKERKKTSEKVIGLVGPFDALPNKYQLDFLYANLDKFDKRIRFRIIGKCDRILTNNRIEYTGYLESARDYVEAISELDALLVPVKIATYGPKNKIIEAMACRVPVFATWEAVIGLDFAENFKNIIVSDENQLINKLNKLIFDEKYMEEIGFNARNTVRKSYNADLYIDKISRTLFKVLRSK